VSVSFLRVQSNAGDQRVPLCTRLSAYLRPPVIRVPAPDRPVSRCRAGGVVRERRAGTGGRRTMVTDQTRALVAGASGSVAARLACVGSRRERGRVKGTGGRAGKCAGTGGWRLYRGAGRIVRRRDSIVLRRLADCCTPLPPPVVNILRSTRRPARASAGYGINRIREYRMIITGLLAIGSRRAFSISRD